MSFFTRFTNTSPAAKKYIDELDNILDDITCLRQKLNKKYKQFTKSKVGPSGSTGVHGSYDKYSTVYTTHVWYATQDQQIDRQSTQPLDPNTWIAQDEVNMQQLQNIKQIEEELRLKDKYEDQRKPYSNWTGYYK